MSFGGSHWCQPMSMDTHRSTDYNEDRSTDYSKYRSTSSAESTAECSAVRIMTHEEFAEKHPHPPSPFYVKIDRPHEPAVDRQRETDIDRPPSPPIDRRAPLTYRVRLPSIDNDRINALRPPPKPLANPPEPTTNPSDTTPEPMQVDEATEGRRLRKRKEKIPKNLKREANEKEMDGFTKRVLRIPVEKPFDEVYFTHRLWMFFRETKETEEDIRRMKQSDRIDEGTIVWLTPEQRDATFFDRRGIYTNKEEIFFPRVEVGKKPLDNRHEILRDQSGLVHLQNNLQPEECFEVVDGKGETVLVAQDQDADKVLDTEGVQLTYRYLKGIHHADDDFGNRKPQAAAHYECFVTSKITLRGTTTTLSSMRNP
ncbi:hypothetical protein F2Q70_00029386 [Brassica cretica]|uniref:Uncharacterized protein n=1 Tax=Brassica cretica TaxID=69181 RepID=A0A8S9FIC1_BRACR|nr:hypothetical protein F2Q70_00029386 [Brassica cretica]